MAYIYNPKHSSPKIKELMDTLREKAEQGVKVRVFLDNNISAFPNYGGSEHFPKHANIEIKGTKAKTKEEENFTANHKKMLVIDGGRRAYLGSANFDANLFSGNVGDCGYVFDGPAARSASEVFDKYFDHGVVRASKAPTSEVGESEACENHKMVCSHFSDISHEDTPPTVDALVGLIQEAKRSIDLQMYYMNLELDPTDPSHQSNSAVVLSKAMNEKCRSSDVAIKVSLDSDSFHKAGIDDSESQRAFLEKFSRFMPACMANDKFTMKIVYTPKSDTSLYAPQIHSKYMIVDQEKAWLGSENWPDSKFFDGNSNCGIVTSAAAEVAKLHDVFSAYWGCSHSHDVNLRAYQRATAATAQSPCSQTAAGGWLAFERVIHWMRGVSQVVDSRFVR